jgi:hypothetical protein
MVRLPGRVAVSEMGAYNGKGVSHKRIAFGLQITVDNSQYHHERVIGAKRHFATVFRKRS